MTLTVLLMLTLPTAAHATISKHRHAGRSVETRIAWLQRRLAIHEGECRGNPSARGHWHCLARVWTRRELREARLEQHARDYDWPTWLPDKYARVGACETGYGKRPGNWNWDSGKYVSAFGIIRAGYNQFAHNLHLPAWNGRNTPRDQYRVAAAIQARYGWGAWGCGGR